MDSITVAVRFRPLSDSEKSSQLEFHKIHKLKPDELWRIIPSPHNIVVNTQSKVNYTYDSVFPEQSTNHEVFQSIAKPHLTSFIEGTSLTIFAYGQTSSGKTYTMRGSPSNAGIIPLTILTIFDQIQTTPITDFRIAVSYLEVYNETINDLLDVNKTKLSLRDNGAGCLEIENLTEVLVENESQARYYFEIGESNRKTGDNSRNAQSSRSHTVFRMSLECTHNAKTTTAEINLVDLAGSEGMSKGLAEDIRSREGSSINKSLLALSTLIEKLSDAHSKKGKKAYLNFRDSKLTRILQGSLSGNSNIVLICTVTPAITQYQESNNTLLFGFKAKKIKISPQINELVNPEMKEKKDKEYIKRLVTDCECIRIENIGLKEALEGLNRENYELNERLDERSNLCRDLESKIASNSNYINVCGARKSIDSYDFNKSMENAIFEKDEEIRSLVQENGILKRQINEQYKKEIIETDEIGTRYSDRTWNYSSLVIALQEKNEVLQNELKEKSIEYETSLDNFDKENNFLRKKMETLESQIDSYSQLEFFQSDIERESKKMLEKICHYDNKVGVLEQDNRNLVLALSKIEDYSKNQQKEYQEIIIKFESASERIKVVQEDLDHVRKTNHFLAEEVKAYENINQTYIDKLQEAEINLESFKIKYDKHLEKYKLLKKEKQRLYEVSKRLEEENSSLYQIKSRIEDKLQDQASKLQEIECLQQNNVLLSAKISDLETDLFRKNEELLKNISPPKQINLETQLMQAITAVDEENSILKNKLEKSEADLESKIQEFKDLERRHNYKRLTASLLDSSMKESITSSEKYQFHLEYKELEGKIQTLENDNETLKKQLEISRSKVYEKENKIGEKQKYIIDLIEQIDDRNRQISTFKAAIRKDMTSEISQEYTSDAGKEDNEDKCRTQ